MVTKTFLISLSILISGKKSPPSSNIDVFIRPILKELQKLRHGVDALDSPNHKVVALSLCMPYLCGPFFIFPHMASFLVLLVRVTRGALIVHQAQMHGWQKRETCFQIGALGAPKLYMAAFAVIYLDTTRIAAIEYSMACKSTVLGHLS